MREGKGFTLVDLVFAVGAIVLVVIPFACSRRDGVGARRAICRTNLRGIGLALEMYANENKDQFPILPDIDQSEPVDYAEKLRLGPGCTAKSLGTGAQQNLCLLVKSGVIGWEMFLCPEVKQKLAARSSAQRYGLGEVVNGRQVSYVDYAIQIPYLRTPEGKNSCPPTADLDKLVVILADRGPQSDFRTRWSSNHGDGEVVLYPDSSVRYSQDKRDKEDLNTAGFEGNNIYTADEWSGTPEKPQLIRNGKDNKTPTDPNGTKDSVLYHRW